MQEVDKTKEDLATEVAHLRQRVAELEKPEVVVEEEAILNTLVEHVIHQDREMKIRWANEAACDSAGLSCKALIGRHCYEIWPKRSDPCPDCPVMKAMETGRLQEVEKITSDGRSWFIRGYPLRDEEGNIVGGIEFTLEITERKQAEKALRESEERFRALFEGAPDAIFLADPVSGEILNANPAASHLLLRPHEEIVGLHQSQIHPPHMKKNAREGFTEHLQQIRRKKQIRPIESVVIRSDGSEVPVEVLAQIVLTQGKKVIQGTFRDITERKQAEDEQRRSEERYRELADNITDVFFAMDKDLRYTYWNKASENLTGIPAKDALGKSLYEIFPEVKGTTAEEVYREALKTQHPQIVEQPYQVGDKNIIFEISIYPLRDGLSVFVKDISERKQTDEQLRLSEERYRFLFENSQTINILIGTDGKILDVNESAMQSLGYKKKSIIGKEVLEFVIPEQREEVAQQLALELKGEYTPPLEIDIITKKGTRTLLFTKGHATLFEKGELTGMLLSAVDITERKKSEKELKIKNNAIDSSINAIAIGEFGGNLTYVNPMFLKMWGYEDAKEVLGKPAVNFWLMQEKAQEIIKSLLKGEPVVGELKAKRKGGSLFDVQLSASLVVDDTGKPMSMMSSFVDITERKQTEEKLRESEERFRTICETAQDFIALKDRDCKFTYVNPAMERAFGISASKLIGKTSEAIFGKEKSTRIIEEDLRVLRGEIVDEEHPSPVEGNSTVQHIIKVPIRNSAGEIIGLCNIGRDITERKQIEEALRESEERFRRVVETMEVGLGAVDENGVYTYVNKYFAQMLGYSIDEMIGRSAFDFMYDEEGRKAQEEIFAKRRAGMRDTIPYEVTRRSKDGQKVYSIMSPTPSFNPDGRFVGSFSIHTDITERKKTENALRESEEKYRLLNENIPVAVYSALPDEFSTTLFLSGRFLELTGYSSDYLLKNPELWTTMLHPKDRDYVWEKIAEHRQKKKLLELEYRIITKDNKVKWIRDHATPVLDENRALVRIDGFMEDITQRKKAENALRESEEKYRSLVESSEDSIYLIDRNYNYVFLNDKHLSRLGMKSNQVVGRAYDEFHAPEESQDFTNRLKTVLKTGQSLSYEYRSQRDNRYFIRTLSPVISAAGGKTAFITVTSKDITERKQAEEKLREREAFNYALFQYNPVETIVVDLEGKVTGFNLAKEKAGDRLPTIGDRMYKDYAGKHEIDMRAELIKCIRSGRIKEFLERKYDDKYLTITISPFSQGAIIISEDITERRRAEEALRASEQFSSTLLHDAPHPILVVNPDTSLRYVNPALEKLTGFSGAELRGRKVPYPWWPKGTSRTTTRGLQEAMRKSHRRVESNFQKKSGERFWVEITSKPAMRDGEVQYLLGNWIDITERKQAEELLQKERDTFYSLLEKAPYGVMVADADGNHSFVNTEFTNITGYTLGDIPTTQDWLHRAYPDRLYRNMVMKKWENDYTQSKSEETFRKQFGRVFSRALNVMCKDGASKEVEFRMSVISDEETIFMLSDITERQRMNALLETAAAEWRTTFDAINDAVCLLDPDGKIIRCNNAMLQLMGKPFSQITNHHCWEVIHGVSEAPRSCPIVLVGKTHHRETEVMFKNSRWFNISVDPLLDEDDNFIGGVHIMSDITDRMRIQNELQDSREQLRNLSVHLEAVREQERTNIAREIHDELAQALTALKMDVSWLDRRLPSDAQSLIEKAKSMTKLIDSTIHTVKRISAELRPGILDDLGLVAAIEWQAEEFHNRTGISCNVTFDPQDLTVDQDRSTAIFRIFQETLTNVARHARATRVAVSLKERAVRLTLRVRDNGIGITEEQIADPQSFGLIGIRERVYPWEGKVSIKGIQGKGTTVIVSVKLARSKNDIEKSRSKGSPS